MQGLYSTMNRNLPGHKITIRQKMRNERITHKKAHGNAPSK